jgi:hypothetical protein
MTELQEAQDAFECQQMTHFQATHDWTTPLEETTVVLRVDGRAHCELCGQEYRRHPLETRVRDQNEFPFLNRGCDGSLLKL